jgi:hypothetical protein
MCDLRTLCQTGVPTYARQYLPKRITGQPILKTENLLQDSWCHPILLDCVLHQCQELKTWRRTVRTYIRRRWVVSERVPSYRWLFCTLHPLACLLRLPAEFYSILFSWTKILSAQPYSTTTQRASIFYREMSKDKDKSTVGYWYC